MFIKYEYILKVCLCVTCLIICSSAHSIKQSCIIVPATLLYQQNQNIKNIISVLNSLNEVINRNQVITSITVEETHFVKFTNGTNIRHTEKQRYR